MNYTKGPLTYEEQADRLLERGLDADREALILRLSSVSYYRLSGYLYPFRERSPDPSEPLDRFVPGTSLDEVWSRYCFDRRLRVLLLDAIERIEVAVRSRLIYHFSHEHGAFGHCDEKNLPDLKIEEYVEWRAGLLVETKRSKEAFTKHFNRKYGDCHRNLPVWMVSELMSMGSLLTFYRGVASSMRSLVASDFDLADPLLLSWLRSLYAARNICAHHSRLWNRVMGYPPSLPQKNKFPDWYDKRADGKTLFTNDRVGILLMICRALLPRISPTSCWHRRVEELFAEYPQIPLRDMGLPQHWQTHSLWVCEKAAGMANKRGKQA
jgi:abortive infection bacteriophage resistance protein